MMTEEQFDKAVDREVLMQNLEALLRLVLLLLMIVSIVLLCGNVVFAATHTHIVNMSVDNNSVSIATPHQVYETTCGQQLSKQFEIIHNYDETLYYYYNYTYNYTITEECECDDNCTIHYNITYCENETNITDLDRLVNATFRKCADAKSVCYDLYHGETNVSYIVNISGEDIRDDVNQTMVEFRDYITTTLFTNEQKCQAWKTNYERCNNQWLADCKRDQNVTAIQLKDNERWMWIGWGVAAVACIGWIGMMLMVFGKSIKSGVELGQMEAKK